MPAVASTSGRLQFELVRILFLQGSSPGNRQAFLQRQNLGMRNTSRTSSVSASLLSTPSTTCDDLSKIGNILAKVAGRRSHNTPTLSGGSAASVSCPSAAAAAAQRWSVRVPSSRTQLRVCFLSLSLLLVCG
jgi:hypothetical protein